MTRIIAAARAMQAALALLDRGGVAAIPTETVYGLAGDATNGTAVARIFEIKGRPQFNPLICHVSDLAMAEQHAEFNELARKLAGTFWPGPLTLVLPRHGKSQVHPLVSAGHPTLALRMPLGFGAELISRLGRPLAAPSANTSGRISATSAQAVERDLGGKVDLIVDAGPSPVGIESTIVKVEHRALFLLRPGGIAAEEIEAAVGIPLLPPDPEKKDAPGMLSSHYAPAASLRMSVSTVLPQEALLAFGPTRAEGADKAKVVINLSPVGDMREAAARLFAALQELDRPDISGIAAEPVPNTGLGVAINDRLKRAAAPRGIRAEEMPSPAIGIEQ